MDQKANPYVLLETVALGTHQDPELSGFGCKPEVSNPAWSQQQKLLAYGTNPSDTTGAEQRMVGSAGTLECERTVVQSPRLHTKENFVEQANLLNRPLRTRMVGGVGAGG